MKLKDFLMASETNDYQPAIIRPAVLASFTIVVLGLRLFLPTTFIHAQASIDASELISRINLERTQRFVPALSTNAMLITAATGKSNDMLTRHYFAHIDPDGNYVWPRIEATGYTPYLTLGENLAMDFLSADAVVAAWMNSPTHRENILNNKFQDQGLASIYGTFEPNHNSILITNLFGTLDHKSIAASQPKKTSPPPPPAPRPIIKSITTTTPPSPATSVKISNDLKIKVTQVSGKLLVEVNTVVSGNPAVVTAKLKGQSITLLAGFVTGEFTGQFTFDQQTDLNGQPLAIQARDKNGQTINSDFTVTNLLQPEPVQNQDFQKLPASPEAKFIRTLRDIFAGIALIYVIFLAIDSVIIHRAKIARTNIHSSPHLLLFLLIAGINLFITWF